MKISPDTPEILQRVHVPQTDRLVERRTTVVRVVKGGGANQDPRHRSRLKQLEDLRSHLDRLSSDVDEQIHAERASKSAPAPMHNTLMCVPKIVDLLFHIFPPAVSFAPAQEETANV